MGARRPSGRRTFSRGSSGQPRLKAAAGLGSPPPKPVFCLICIVLFLLCFILILKEFHIFYGTTYMHMNVQFQTNLKLEPKRIQEEYTIYIQYHRMTIYNFEQVSIHNLMHIKFYVLVMVFSFRMEDFPAEPSS